MIFRPTNIPSNIIFLILTTIVFLLVSYGMHKIIETPYFMFKPKKQEHPVVHNRGRLAMFLLTIFFIVTIFSAYSSKYNFFSTIETFKKTSVFISVPEDNEIEITEKPVSISFTAPANNLGVILIHLTNRVGDPQKQKMIVDPLKNQKLLARLKESGSAKWYASQETSPAEIGDSASYPIGIPLIKDSISKNYVLELSIKDIDYKSSLYLHTNPYVLQTVQQINKKRLISHPILLVKHTAAKMMTILSDTEAQLVVLCIVPFFLLLFVL